MIDAALIQIAGQLNQHLRQLFQVGEDLAVLSNLFEPGGSAVPQVANRLVIFLAGVERDSMAYRAAPQRGAGSTLKQQEPVFLNLLMMCAANFSGSNYPEALKFLSAAVGFFQAMPVIDHHNAPLLDARLERLLLNIENLSSSEMHSLWGIHGGRYMPSVLYRVRMVCLDSGHVAGRDMGIGQTDVRVLS
jgi:hypothetical protein